MPVEGQRGEGAEQPGAEAAEQREHRAGQLGPAFHVEQTQLGAHLEVRYPLRLGVGRGGVGPGVDDHVVLGAGPVGGVVRRQVGQEQEGLAQLVPGGLGQDVERPFLLAEGAAAGGQPVGGGRVPGLAGRADLLRERLHL